MAVTLLVACDGDSPAGPARDSLRVGTWGGDSAGIIVNDTIVHVHINCTYGDFPGPVELDANGQFSVRGSYQLRAFPIVTGPTMPALFTGVLDGNELSGTVVVIDTIEIRLVGVGPVRVRFGREPELGPCPICAVPGNRMGMTGPASADQFVTNSTTMPSTAPIPARKRHPPRRPGSPPRVQNTTAPH
jgi:hypothetical protein